MRYLIFYFLLSLAHLLAEQWQVEWLILATKPLLISLLALWFYRRARPPRDRFSRLLLAGLIFSVGGDSLLMLVGYGPRIESFFLLGLGSFLLAQCCYAAAFWSYGERHYLRRRPVAALPLVAFYAFLMWVLAPHLTGVLQVAVAIYGLAITTMALGAVDLRDAILFEPQKIQKNTKAGHGRIYWGLLAGVLLFLLSDSLIAWNKFVQPLPGARFSIMATYLAGQFLIVWHAARLVDLARAEPKGTT